MLSTSPSMFRLLIDKVTNFFKSYGMSCKLCCTNMNFTSFHHQSAAPSKIMLLGHVRTAKAKIRLRRCAVWSGPSLSASRIIEYYKVYQRRTNARMRLCACAGWIWIFAFCACSATPFRLNTIECINGEPRPERDLAHAQDDLSPHILRILELTRLI